MNKSIERGRVVEEKRYYIEVGNEKYHIPEGCQTKEPQLEVIAGQEVDVLHAGRKILALRVNKEVAKKFKIPPIITCYLMPPHIVFDPDIFERIRPVITQSLLDAEVLDRQTTDILAKWHKEAQM